MQHHQWRRWQRQHPTQCLLDLMTIYEEFGHFDQLKVAIVGDITHSRVAKSNMQMLKRLGAKVYFSGPPQWYDNEFEVYGHWLPLDELVNQVDVMMMLRVQHERHDGSESFSKEAYLRDYGLTVERAAKCKTMPSSCIQLQSIVMLSWQIH